MVPLVYMMVHRSLGAGGDGSAGLAAPSARNAAHVCALMPASLHACSRRPGLRVEVREPLVRPEQEHQIELVV